MSQKRKTLGIIGGVGPLSTAYFMEVLINMTDASNDQEHIDMVILNHCEIPDRTAYILDKSCENPVPMMQKDAKKLEALGCDVIVTPCNTAHYFYDELKSSVSVPFINMISETAKKLNLLGAKKVGIMATNGTVQSNLFQDALQCFSIESVIPDKKHQEYVMEFIYDNVKASVPVDREKFNQVIDEFLKQGCDKVILGCTELSILKKEYDLDDFYVDALEVLCEKAIEACGKKVKR